MSKRKATTRARPQRKRTPSFKVRREETQLDSSSNEEEATPNPTSVLLEQISATNQRLDQMSQLLQTHIQGGSCDRPQPVNQPSTSAQPFSQSSTAAAQSHNQPSTSNRPLTSAQATPQDWLGAAVEQLVNPEDGESTNRAPFLKLGATVSPAVKAQIQDGAYIELLTLMSKSDRKMEVSFNGETPVFRMSTATPPIQSIFVWLRLFGMYAAIYLEAEKNRHEGPGMFAYMLNIMSLHRSQPPSIWLRYDERFRQLKAVPDTYNTGPLQWDTTNLQILFEISGSIANPANTQTTSHQNQPPHLNQPFRSFQNVCFDYNDDKCTRSVCRYRHNCSFCGKPNHTRKKCYAANGNQTSRATGLNPEAGSL